MTNEQIQQRSAFIQNIDNGKAKVLTVEAASALRGKRINYFFFAYNPQTVREMVVGDVVTEYEYNQRVPKEGFASFADYWDQKLPARAARARQTLVLLDEAGNYGPNYIQCLPEWVNYYDVPTFICSDEDREVYYMEVEQ